MRGWYQRPAARLWTCPAEPAEVTAFHAGLPGYQPTPLVELPDLAGELGVGRVYVKDESARLGLPAFKILGASWAVCRLLAARAGMPAAGLDLPRLRMLARTTARVTLVTATDGNHGRAVARMAGLLGLPAEIYLPAVVPADAAAAIASEGATVVTVAGCYDAAVRRAAEAAEADPTRELVQDTAWPGYQEVPRWIVQGYSTLLHEIDAQLHAAGAAAVALLSVPVGVGSLAQAAVAHHRAGRAAPSRAPAAVLGVEPDTAACVLASLLSGRSVSVPTGTTVMAGLNCGTPSSLAWPYLRAGMDAAVAITDDDAVQAVGDLAALGVTSGPSGAASLAGARAALAGRVGDDRRTALGIGPGSVVVLVSTEGPVGSTPPSRTG